MSIDTILPTNIDPVINDLDVLGAERLEGIADEAAVVGDVRDAMAVDARYLPVLAEDYQTYFLDEATNEEERRRMIAASLSVHRRKGSIWALRMGFEATGYPVTVQEWTEYGGDPYYFRLIVDVSGREIGDEQISKIAELTEEMKNVRSHLDYIQPELGNAGRVEAICVSGGGETVTVAPYTPDDVITAAPVGTAAIIHAVDTTTIYPKEESA